MLAPNEADQLLTTALDAVRNGGDWRSILDAIPLPVYTTDAEGAVTYWNQACVDFAGRTPKLGEDRWCVTWQLYRMTGEPLPHDECPMAVAIKERRCVRDEVAIVERPDGTRRAFTPYPAPVFDDDGSVSGAVNLLIDVSDEQADVLSDQAARCRRLAYATTDPNASTILESMASDYSKTAAALKASKS